MPKSTFAGPPLVQAWCEGVYAAITLRDCPISCCSRQTHGASFRAACAGLRVWRNLLSYDLNRVGHRVVRFRVSGAK